MRIAEESEEYIRDYPFNNKLSTAKQAEEYVKSYFEEIRGIALINHGLGFDFCNESKDLFVEVKGSKKAFKHLQGWYFTKDQHEKASSCRGKKIKYEIHIVVGIGSDSPEHYVEYGEEFLNQANESTSWWFRRLKDKATGREMRKLLK
jgi:hypothetical protein